MMRTGQYVCLLFIALLTPSTFYGQKKANVKLPVLLSSLEKKYGLTFSYDGELVKDVPVALDTNASLPNILQYLNDKTAFFFQRLDAKNILVKPRQAGCNFMLCGSMVDRKTQQALYSAIIYSKKSNFHTTCLEDGSFFKLIKYMPDDTVFVFMIGYENLAIPIANFISGECRPIAARSKSIEMNEVCVTAYLTSGISYDALDNSISVRPRNREILPGQTNGDLFLSLDALPGISMPDSKAGNLNIRGSTPDQTLITFDNIPLYQKGHIFGTVSAIDVNVIENIKVQRSSMSANRGGRVGGIIEISSPGGVVNKPAVTVTSSMLDASAYVHVPLKQNKLSLVLSGRNSYPYSWNLPPMQAISDYIFQQSIISGAQKNNPQGISNFKMGYRDGNAKLIYSISDKHKATLSALYNADNFSVNLTDNFKKTTSLYDLKSINNGINGMLRSDWNSKFATLFSVTGSLYDQDAHTNAYAATDTTNSHYENKVQDLKAFLEGQWKIDSNHVLKMGYEFNYYSTTYIRETDDLANVSLRQGYDTKGSLNTLYLNMQSLFWNRLSLDAGLRLNYFSLGQQVSAEPRVILGYKLAPHFRLKSSAGYQKQFIAQISGVSMQNINGIPSLLWLLADDRSNVPIVNSYQATFGGLFEKSGWLVDLEGYVKQVNNVSNISITQPLSQQPFIQGSISTIGADLLVRKQWRHLDAWISYTLSKSMMRFDSVLLHESFYSLFDQTHVLDLACAYHIGQWKFSVAWKYRTGFAVLPGIRTRMMAGANSAPQATGTAPPPPAVTNSSQRFPDYHMLDASIQYGFPKKPAGWRGYIGVSGLNCYNQKNIIDKPPLSVKGGKPVPTNKYMMGFMPNVVLSFSF